MYLLLIIITVILIFAFKRRIIVNKIKMFFKEYKALIILEITFIAIIAIVWIFNKAIIIKEEDPHTGKILKSTVLKEEEKYEYYITKYDNQNNMYEEKTEILVKEVGLFRIKVIKNQEELKFDYGTGFRYYGILSCSCGTPIIFYNPYNQMLKVVSLTAVIIDLLIILVLRENKKKGERQNVLYD